MITSVQNNKVKLWNKLKKRKERQEQQVFLVEGYHLVQEAMKSNWEVREVILQGDTECPEWVPENIVTTVSDNVFKSLSDTKTPQGIAAVVAMKQQQWSTFQKLLVVDAVQDPGNLGTMIRTADAAGFDGILLGEGTVDLFNDKVVRATQGSLFHLPIFQVNILDKISELKEQDFHVWVSTLEGADPYQELPVPSKVALVVGNEGAGINPAIVEAGDQKVHIPIYGQAESLNVSIAAGILLYYVAHT